MPLNSPSASCLPSGALLLSGVGLAFNQGDYERAKTLMAPLLAGVPLLEGEEELPGTLELYEGYLCAGDGDFAAAERHLAESVRSFSSCGTGGRWIEAFTHNGLGSPYGLRGDLDGSGREMQLSGELGRQYGNVAAEMQSAVFQVITQLHIGNLDEASRLLCEAADIVEEYPFYEANAYCVEVAGAVASARGNAIEAARALGMGQALRDVVGARVWPLVTWQATIEQAVQAALDEDAYTRQVARGREVDLLTLADGVRRLGFAGTGQIKTVPRIWGTEGGPVWLAGVEWDSDALVADGLSPEPTRLVGSW